MGPIPTENQFPWQTQVARLILNIAWVQYDLRALCYMRNWCGFCGVLPTGAAPGQDPTPKGGGGVPPPIPLYRPQNGCTEQWVLWAPEILF